MQTAARANSAQRIVSACACRFRNAAVSLQRVDPPLAKPECPKPTGISAPAATAVVLGALAWSLQSSPVIAIMDTEDPLTTSAIGVRSSSDRAGSLPSMLSADDESDNYTRQKLSKPAPAPLDLSPAAIQRKLVAWSQSPKFGRNLVEYAVLAAVFWRIRAAGRPDAVAEKLGVWDKKSAEALVNTRWELTLDVGREQGTWMPPNWARSGRRIEIPLAVELQADGLCKPLGVGTYVKLGVDSGTWNIQGDTLRLNLQISGFERGDISLPSGKLYFKTYAWGNMISQNKGRLLVLQRRNFIRTEWRTVGSFKATQMENDGVEYDTVGGPKLFMAPAKVKEGDAFFPEDVF